MWSKNWPALGKVTVSRLKSVVEPRRPPALCRLTISCVCVAEQFPKRLFTVVLTGYCGNGRATSWARLTISKQTSARRSHAADGVWKFDYSNCQNIDVFTAVYLICSVLWHCRLGDRKIISPVEKLCHFSPKRFSSWTIGGENRDAAATPAGTTGIRPLKYR